MADTFKFELVSPERLLVSQDVKSVRVPGDEGDYLVLPDHSPLMSTLRPGILVVDSEDGEKSYFVKGGFADTGSNSLTILAELAVTLDDMSSDDKAAQIAEAKQAADEATDDLLIRHCNETVACLEGAAH
ncbi:MAG: ATP synthase epsilon chain [Methyloligella sp.]|nr:MAG: ATP synthase epsilon chain [Methyloligella sp.]